jgi:hypothetical protein
MIAHFCPPRLLFLGTQFKESFEIVKKIINLYRNPILDMGFEVNEVLHHLQLANDEKDVVSLSVMLSTVKPIIPEGIGKLMVELLLDLIDGTNEGRYNLSQDDMSELRFIQAEWTRLIEVKVA